MNIFLSPFDALIPKIPFSFFADFWVRVTSEAQGFSLGRILGSRQLGPFGGGSSQGALSTPPPPRQLKARLPVLPIPDRSAQRPTTDPVARGTHVRWAVPSRRGRCGQD